MSICTANTIGTFRSRKLLRVLFDSGTNRTLIKRSVIPKGVIPKELAERKSFATSAGRLTAQEMVTLRGITLPEFDKSRHVDSQ